MCMSVWWVSEWVSCKCKSMCEYVYVHAYVCMFECVCVCVRLDACVSVCLSGWLKGRVKKLYISSRKLAANGFHGVIGAVGDYLVLDFSIHIWKFPLICLFREQNVYEDIYSQSLFIWIGHYFFFVFHLSPVRD